MTPQESLLQLIHALIPIASSAVAFSSPSRPAPSWVELLGKVAVDPDTGADDITREFGAVFCKQPAFTENFVDLVRSSMLILKSIDQAKLDTVLMEFLSTERISLLRDEARAKVKAEEMETIRKELVEKLTPEVTAELEKRENIKAAVYIRLEKQLTSSVRAELREKLTASVREELNEELTQQLEGVVARNGRMKSLAKGLLKARKVSPEQAGRALAAAEAASEAEE